MTVLLYHWTREQDVEAILREGFRDTCYTKPCGVHLSDDPAANYPGGRDDVLLVVEIPDAIDVLPWLNPEQICGYRDFIVRAEVVNGCATVRRHEQLG